ncbi:MAG: hypothetical protein ACFCVE_13035 [Phycisphaerae bacterium]
MSLFHIKWWQWLLAGVLLGAGVGYAWTNSRGLPVKSDSLTVFLRDVGRVETAPDGQTTAPRIADVRLMPRRIDPQKKEVEPVVYGRLVGWAAETNAPVYEPRVLPVVLPVELNLGGAAQTFDGFPALMDALADRPGREPVAWARAWQARPAEAYGLSVGVGVLCLGLLVPAGLRLLGGKPEREPDATPADRRPSKSRSKSTSPGITARRGPTAEETAQLQDVIAAYDTPGTAGSTPATAVMNAGKEPGEDAATPAGTGQPGPRPLDTRRPQSTPQPPAQPERPRDFKGEYYPVARPTTKNGGEDE